MGDGLVQDCGNFIDNELPQSCLKQSIYTVRNNQYSLYSNSVHMIQSAYDLTQVHIYVYLYIFSCRTILIYCRDICEIHH